MNSLRMFGHVLLWAGFLTGSVGMLMRRELDLLPEAERTAILALSPTTSVASDLANQVSGKSWAELETDEFVKVLDSIPKPVEPSEQTTSEQDTEEAPASTPAEEETKPKVVVPSLNKASLIQLRTSRIESLWPTINWYVYVPALLVGGIGAALLRSTKPNANGGGGSSGTSLEPLRTALANLLAEVGVLEKELPQMAPEEVVAFIDDRCVRHCNSFADQREIIKSLLGLSRFGEIMSEFASGE
ncbi:MAG: hypothetical protein JNL67_20310 [Planctomycetaceae bacterium]|nr:hypothetical protein [Planctomycetaceae bacterium]